MIDTNDLAPETDELQGNDIPGSGSIRLPPAAAPEDTTPSESERDVDGVADRLTRMVQVDTGTPETKPTLESCGWDEDQYNQELEAYHERKADTELDAVFEKREQHERQAKLNKRALDSAVKFREDHKDFDAVVSKPGLQWSPTVLATLRTAGAAAAGLAYELASNPDRLAKIATMPPQAAGIDFWKIQ